MRSVCLDTHVLIWGVKEQATPGQERMIPRAKAFLSEPETVFVIPAVGVAELLMPVPSELHAMTLNLLRGGFAIAPYDTKAAALFAKLWRERTDDGVIEQLKSDGETKTKIKVDGQIVATAIAQGVAYIVSHDGGLKKFAGDAIEVRELPTGSTQLPLIDGESSSSGDVS